MAKIDPHRYPGPLEELEKNQGVYKKDNTRVKIAIIAGLIALAVGGLVTYLVYSGEDIESLIEDLVEEGGVFSLIPFWLIIFIPFMFAKKKKKK